MGMVLRNFHKKESLLRLFRLHYANPRKLLLSYKLYNGIFIKSNKIIEIKFSHLA